MPRYKDSVKRSVGRPRLDELTERQALIKREIITPLKPYYKAAVERLAQLAGIKSQAKESLLIESDDSKKLDVSANVQYNACKTIMDKFENGIINLWEKGDTTPATPEESEETPKLAPVRKLQLTVKSED